MYPSRLISNTLPSATGPVRAVEFVDALSKVLNTTKIHDGILGLAISGGVDSMALACLCSHIQNSSQEPQLVDSRLAKPMRNFAFQAFIVDHGIRCGSDLEAESVSKALIKRGIQAKVLKIDWHGHEKLADKPNFETLARRYRFQVLGNACRDMGINSLLLAHHQDDQAETVMMRIMAGHRRQGLMGIRIDSEIPECYGIHGVHESSEIDYLQDNARNLKPESSSTNPASKHQKNSYTGSILGGQLAIESGGVRIYRPLLGFHKARLVATCQAEKMEWFEDLTNKDPTFTTRNAIRHMYNSYAMPTALSKPALLALSEKFNDEARSQLSVVNSCLSQCNITKFDTRSGVLGIHFPSLNLVRDLSSVGTVMGLKQVAAEFLRRIIVLVTPEEHVRLSSLYGTIGRVFPELVGDHEMLPQPSEKFTVAGVQFHLLSNSSSQDGRPSPSHDCGVLKKCEWFISRQSYTSSTSSRSLIIISATTEQSSKMNWSQWSLFDGRYWVRVQNFSGRPLVIRPFCRKDLKSFRISLHQGDKRRLRDLLRDIAPGDVRWTLPTLVLQGVDKKDRVLALPTLGVASLDVATLVKWEVRYKKINLADLHIKNSKCLYQI